MYRVTDDPSVTLVEVTELVDDSDITGGIRVGAIVTVTPVMSDDEPVDEVEVVTRQK